jgi:2-polyprenyl-3-methyl-5-hydroxy-6-metoxy-1,4-benzoquinol methylase
LDEIVWKKAQEAQLDHHKRYWKQTTLEEHLRKAGQDFYKYGLRPDDYKGLTVMDLGCGSNLLSKFFREATIIAVDPLAFQYLVEIKDCNLMDAAFLYNEKAEHTISYLYGHVDFVICRDTLDQCENPEEVIINISKYLKQYGKAFISFHIRYKPDIYHPHCITEDQISKYFGNNDLIITKMDIEDSPLGDVKYRIIYQVQKVA